MKRAILTVVTVLATLPVSTAMASKARVGSLLGTASTIDTQTVFTHPSHVHSLDNHLAFEFGPQGNGAEGGFLREVGDGRLFIYLGHEGDSLRDNTNLLDRSNPIDVIYGIGTMAFGVSVSNTDNKTADTKETTLVGRFGMNYGDNSWFSASISLVDTTEGPGGFKSENPMQIDLGVNHSLNDNHRVFGNLIWGKPEVTPGGGAPSVDTDVMGFEVGFEDRSFSVDGADIYYGIKLTRISAKVSPTDTEQINLRLPAFIGMEYAAADWLTIRASFQQNVLFGGDTVDSGTGKTESGVSADSLVAAGLGLKYKSILLDGSLTAASNGQVNGTQFLSQAALTYFF